MLAQKDAKNRRASSEPCPLLGQAQEDVCERCVIGNTHSRNSMVGHMLDVRRFS